VCRLARLRHLERKGRAILRVLQCLHIRSEFVYSGLNAVWNVVTGGGRRGAGQANPLTDVAQDVQVVAPLSGTPHQQVIEERKKELGVNVLQYTAAFMMQFSEVRLQIARRGVLEQSYSIPSLLKI
jgi:hypothetical protein